MYYTTQEGFYYYIYLLKEYLYSDFYSDKKITKSISFTQKEINKIINTKKFKDFTIQREKDFFVLSSFLSNVSYSLIRGFGKTLEINPGKFECVTSLEEFNYTFPFFVTKYIDPLFFKPNVLFEKGDLSSIELISPEKNEIYPFLVHETHEAENKMIGGKTLRKTNISDADSIFYFNDLNLIKMCMLLNYANKKNIVLATGLVTNIYDKDCERKIEELEEAIYYLQAVMGNNINIEQTNQEGTIIRLIHTI